MEKHTEHSIGLIGQGLIYQNVQQHLAERFALVSLGNDDSALDFATCALVVYCSDVWTPHTLREVNRRCLQAGVALLPIFTQFDEGIIGPCVLPQQQGCTSCAEWRKLAATSSEPERKLFQQYLSQPRKINTVQPWLTTFSLKFLAVLAREEIAAYLRQPESIRTSCAQLVVSLTTLECSRHTFLPVPTCADCGELIRDSAELAKIALQSRPKANAHTYRMSQPLATPEQIVSTYVDTRTGLVSSLVVENTNLLPLASTRLASESAGTAGTGCTLHPEQSKLVSVLEVVERHAGLRPRGKRTMTTASYNQLLREGQPALDPTTLGLHTPEQYARDQDNHGHRHLVAYNHDLVCHWVWGYSFQKQAPILVPEHCAYYGVHDDKDNPTFVHDVSNGCALGSCLEEAIYHGILEVVERDAFLLTWYARLHAPHLDLDSLTDPTVRLLLKHLEQQAGYSIRALNITMDHAVPCLCLLGVDDQKREGKPHALVAAGSHPHPEQALLKALREFAMYLAYPRRLDEQGREHAYQMFTDASLVQKMEHHPMIYYLPEAFERLEFLAHPQRTQSFQEAFSDIYSSPSEHLDLRDDLEELLNSYLSRGQDVIVVDQTAPEHQPCGLRCVKVIMPGMLPMTFGQNNRRVTGFERLHQLPHTLGYQDHPLTVAEINPHPHPFF